MARFIFQPLESRVYLSLSSSAPESESASQIALHATPASSNADASAVKMRQQLIGHFTDTVASSLRKTLRHSGVDPFDATLLKYMDRRAGPTFYFNGKQLTRVFADPTFRQNGDISMAIDRADSVLNHVFPEQLSATTFSVQLPAEIEWDAQPSTTDNADFLHGLNQMSFWKDLGIAFRYTGDGKYVRELVSELTSWSAQNPPLKNPNDWATSSPHWWLLDAANRAANWTYAYFMVLGSADWTGAANTLFLSRLWDHGDFLSNVTPSGYAKNRTALHAAGLSELGLLFTEFTDAPAWSERGTDMTFRCLAAQFFPDGGDVEESPSYAMVTLDSMLGSYQLALLNGGNGAWTKNRRRLLENGVEAVYQLLTVQGSLPSLSDTYRSSTVGRFLNRAAILLGNPKYSVVPPVALEDLIIAHGDIEAAIGGQGDLEADRGLSYALPDAGYYVLRNKDGFSAVFDAGPKGGTHGHYDLLNFELDSAVADIPDPGPYIYDDSAERQYIISTPAHNTISIDGLNHEDIEGAHNPKIVVDDFSEGTNEARVTAHHYAYDDLSGQPTVGRTLWMDQTPNTLPIVITIDWASSGGGHEHTFTSSLNLNTSNLTQTAPGDLDMQVTRSDRMRVQTLLMPGQTTQVTDTQISNEPPPDDLDPAKRYAVSQTGTSALFVTLISEYVAAGTDPTQPASIAFESTPRKGQPVKLKLTMPDGSTRSLEFAPPF